MSESERDQDTRKAEATADARLATLLSYWHEECGYEECDQRCGGSWFGWKEPHWKVHVSCLLGLFGVDHRWNGLPKFGDSLRAMHAVEAELARRGLDDAYAWVVRAQPRDDPAASHSEDFCLLHATAAQKRDAAIRVLEGQAPRRLVHCTGCNKKHSVREGEEECYPGSWLEVDQ